MQLILNAKDGVGALIQRRGKDVQTEVMKQRLCVSLLLELTPLCLKSAYGGFGGILLTNRGNLHTHLPLHIYYYSASLVPTYSIYLAVLFGYSCLNDE